MIGLYAVTLSPGAGLSGARGEPLREIRCGELALLTGDPPPPLSAEALRAYDAAVRQIAQSCEACLPARFGAAAEDEAALLRSVEPRAAGLLEALQLVRGREQMTLRIHGPGRPAPLAKADGPGTRYLEERRRARALPELDPLRSALEGLVRAERLERHTEPGLLASVYHLIDRGAAARYRALVERVSLEGLRVALSGPWPAWSFAPEVVTP